MIGRNHHKGISVLFGKIESYSHGFLKIEGFSHHILGVVGVTSPIDLRAFHHQEKTFFFL